MKRLLLLFAAAIFLLGTLESCNQCRGVDCDNGGTCNDGECDCLKGFEGDNCEIKDICVLNDVVCVFGECEEGICNCNEGIELADCSREARQKFIGKFNTTEYVVNVDTVGGIEIRIEKDLLNVPKMEILNLYNFNNFSNGFFSRVEAEARVNTKQFTIPRQAPDDTQKEIDGSGFITVSPDSTIINLTIQYTVYDGNKEISGTVEGVLVP